MDCKEPRVKREKRREDREEGEDKNEELKSREKKKAFSRTKSWGSASQKANSNPESKPCEELPRHPSASAKRWNLPWAAPGRGDAAKHECCIYPSLAAVTLALLGGPNILQEIPTKSCTNVTTSCLACKENA